LRLFKYKPAISHADFFLSLSLILGAAVIVMKKTKRELKALNLYGVHSCAYQRFLCAFYIEKVQDKTKATLKLTHNNTGLKSIKLKGNCANFPLRKILWTFQRMRKRVYHLSRKYCMLRPAKNT